MGNTISSKTNGVSALTSIRDDVMERLTKIDFELTQVESKLINMDLLSSEEVKSLLKTRTELRRNKKLITSNMEMASNGLFKIQQKDFEELQRKNDEITRILNQHFKC